MLAILLKFKISKKRTNQLEKDSDKYMKMCKDRGFKGLH